MIQEQFKQFFKTSENYLPVRQSSKNLAMQLFNEKTEFDSCFYNLTQLEEDSFMNLEVGQVLDSYVPELK